MKAKTSTGPRFDTERSSVTGNALHVYPTGDGRLHVGLSYPVSLGGEKTIERELVVVLSPEDRARLAAYLASDEAGS